MRKGEYLLGMLYSVLATFFWLTSALITDGKQLELPWEFSGALGVPVFVTCYQTAFFISYLVFYLPMMCNHCISNGNRKGYCSLHGNERKSIKSSEKKCDEWRTETVPEVKVDQDTVRVNSSYRETSNYQRIDQKLDRQEKPTSFVKDIDAVTCCFDCIVKQSGNRITLLEMALHSGTLCLIWCTMFYCHNMSLMLTSFLNHCIISTCIGPFSFILSVLLFKKSLDLGNIVGQAAGIVGIVMMVLGDDTGNVLGNVLAILSAFVYACFLTLVALRLKNDGNISVYLYLGLMGFFSMICFWPIFLICYSTSVEPMRLPDKAEILGLTGAGFMNLISVYFSIKSIQHTTPLIATLGLSLHIPTILIFEFLAGNEDFVESKLYLLGTGFFVTGFVLVNLNVIQNLEQDIDNKQSSKTISLLEEQLVNKQVF